MGYFFEELFFSSNSNHSLMSVAASQLKFKKLVKKPTRKGKPFFAPAVAKKKVIVASIKKYKKKKSLKKAKAAQKFVDKNRKLRQLKLNINTATAKNIKHPSALSKLADTKKAVDIGNHLDKSSKAKANQVAEMGEQKPEKFNAEKFSSDILTNINKVIPKSEAEMQKDGTASEKMAEAQQSVTNSLEDEKQKSGGNLASTTSATPDLQSIPEKEVLPLTPEIPQVAISITNAAISPDLKTPQETSLAKDSALIDQQMKENKVTEAQLNNSNEPSFKAAASEKCKSQENARSTHLQYLNKANPVKSSVENQTKDLTSSGLAKSAVKRKKNLNNVSVQQIQQKAKEEKVRKKIATDLELIYSETKTKVETRLEQLSTTVNTTFETALDAANKKFEDHVRERTATSWLDDLISWASGIPTSIQNIFKEEQDIFINSLRPVVLSIGKTVEFELNEAVKEIDLGKQKVKKYWDTLDKDAKKIGADLYTSVNDQFTELETSVEEASENLKDNITTKFNEAISKLEETYEKIKEENKSWLEKAFDAVVGTIKAILEMKDLLLSILRKAANAIEAIITDPIGFLGNLITAIKQGFKNFSARALEHLKVGFLEWLMGNLPPSIKFPAKWDMKGIFEFVMSVLGLTWTNIKLRAVKMYGATVVAALETGFEIFAVIKNEGIGGLWKFIMDKVGNLQTLVMDAIQNMLIEKVITAGISWIIGLFNPAGAFIKACKMIYDVVVWFINNAKRLLGLINSIVDSVVFIVAGNISQAANFVENSLKRAIPIVIGFLAGLLGIGDLSKKVQALLDKIQAPINKAIDWVLEKAGAFVKKLAKMTVAGVKKLLGWLGRKKPFVAKDKKTHSVNVQGTEEHPKIIIKSDPKTLEQLVAEFKETADYKKDPIYFNNRISKAISLRNTFENAMKKNHGENVKYDDDFDRMANTLIDYIKDLFGSKKEDEKRIVDFQELHAGVASGMSAKVLVDDNTIGKTTSAPTGKHKILNSRKYKGGNISYYVQGHLLNNHLGGDISDANLTPLQKDTNAEHERIIEKSLKKYYNEKKKLKYEVTANFGLSAPPIAVGSEIENLSEDKKIKKAHEISEINILRKVESESVPVSLSIKAYYYKKDGEKEVEKPIFTSTIKNRVDTSEDSYLVK